MGFLDKVKAASQEATAKVKEGAGDVQAKREIGKTYDELGKKAYELAESGAISHPEIAALVTKINELKASVEDEEKAAVETAEGEPPASSEPPATDSRT